MGGACGTYRNRKGAYRVLVGRPEGKRQLGRPKVVRGEMVLKLIFKKWIGGHGLDLSGSG
jgi:hypothetical protein